MGGGGARAARRNRIRRPPALRRGNVACQTHSLPFSADPGSIQEPPRAPPPPPTLPSKILRAALFSHFFRSEPQFLQIFADRKFIKNRTPQKLTQNRKNPTPWRPKLDFGVIFAPFSLPFLLPFRKTSIFCKHAYSLGRAQYLRFWHLIFSSKIHSKIMFFRDAVLDLIFLHFMLIFCEKV